MPEPVEAVAAAVRAGDRRALAQAITLVESTRPDHRDEAAALLDLLAPDTGNAVRLGISGAPGAGKSTFIEALGIHLLDADRRIAVLAVDPSSARTGGSILGDKTRMEQLSRRAEAFIRPSPSGGTLGGVARRTREAMLVCEAAGFDTVVVETVGVGQSEVTVAGMVDLFVLLLAPGGGDELQGVKRGIVELADLLVVNKADGDLAPAARRTASDYAQAMHLVRGDGRSLAGDAGAAVDVDPAPTVLTCSALTGEGIGEVWQAIAARHDALRRSGALAARRAEQAKAWLWSELADTLLDELRDDPAVRAQLPELEGSVATGHTSAAAAARRLLATFRRDG